MQKVYFLIIVSPTCKHFIGKTCNYHIHWLATHKDDKGEEEFTVNKEKVISNIFNLHFLPSSHPPSLGGGKR